MLVIQKAPILKATLSGGVAPVNIEGGSGTLVYRYDGFPRSGAIDRIGFTQYDGDADGATLNLYSIDPAGDVPGYDATTTEIIALADTPVLTAAEILQPFLIATLTLAGGDRFVETAFSPVVRRYSLYRAEDPLKRDKLWLQLVTTTPAAGKLFSFHYTVQVDDG